MRRLRKFILFFTLSSFYFTSCHQASHEVGFYYWKTQYSRDTLIEKVQQKLHANLLYTRIMDIDFNDTGIQAVPVSPITFADPIPENQDIVPVVLINQRIFSELDSLQIRGLAGKIVPLVETKIKQAGKKHFDELQIDCDWTAASRDKFFYLLDYLQTLPALQHVTVSSTLRLRQVKDAGANGIPPVNKVTLMCYNMGNLQKFGNHNSILNLDDLKTYLQGTIANYPIKMDIALPLFERYVVFRNNNCIGVSKYIEKSDIQNPQLFTQNPGTALYILNQDLPKANLKKGDVLRYEQVTKEDLIQTAKYLNKELKDKEQHIIFDHLDQNILAKYPDADLKEIIDAF